MSLLAGFSFVLGLHVSHLEHQTYTDYNSEKVETSQGKSSYPEKEYNQGWFDNKVIGLRYNFETVSVTYLNFDNSFADNTHAIDIATDFKLKGNLYLETTILATYGYSYNLILQDEDKSSSKTIITVPTFGLVYKTKYVNYFSRLVGNALINGLGIPL